MKKVLLVGDSIRMGYDKYVKLALEKEAEVFYPAENCRFSQYVLRYIHEWIDACGGEPDCIHWNAGLWDCLRLFEDEPATPLAVYQQYIERICVRIRKMAPNAKVIFATSTPIREEAYLQPERAMRFNREIEAYNAVAVEIVKRHGFAVNDLYSRMKDVPVSWYSDKTHFYTKEATAWITGQVLQTIEAAIGIHGTELDYDALFAAPKEISGF